MKRKKNPKLAIAMLQALRPPSLGIGFSVSYAKKRMKAGFACRYNVGNLGDVNIVAFHYPLIADWELMEKDAEAYRMRTRSAIREEMIHSIQVITVKSRYDSSIDLSRQFKTAQRYYQHLQDKIIEELAACEECPEIVCTAASFIMRIGALSPTLAEALAEIERTIQNIHQIESTAIYSTTPMTQ